MQKVDRLATACVPDIRIGQKQMVAIGIELESLLKTIRPLIRCGQALLQAVTLGGYPVEVVGHHNVRSMRVIANRSAGR